MPYGTYRLTFLRLVRHVRHVRYLRLYVRHVREVRLLRRFGTIQGRKIGTNIAPTAEAMGAFVQ